MKKLLFAMGLALASIPNMAVAQDATLDCATILRAENSPTMKLLKDQCTTEEKITPETVREWGSLGKEFSTAVVETARELGIAANEFLYTPVGILIALYFMWDMIGGIIIGIPLFIFIWWSYFFISRKIVGAKVHKEYEHVPQLFGLFTLKKITKEEIKYVDEPGVVYIFMGVPAIILSFTTIGALIF